MNKTFLAFFFALSILSTNAGFLDDFTKTVQKGTDALNKGLSTVDKYVSATEKTVDVVTKVVESISKDLDTVSSDVKALATDIETEFNALYKNGMRIVDTTKKFAEAGYNNAKTLFTDVKKQLDTIIVAAQADIERAVESAKATVAQLATDVQITYRDGKLVASRVEDSTDLTAIINSVKTQNKEALQNTINSLNSALAEANEIIKQAKDYLAKYQTIASSTAATTAAGAKELVAKMKEFIAKAQEKLTEFKKNQETNLKTIVEDAQKLFKSTQSILDKAQTAIKTTTDAIDRGTTTVKEGRDTIKEAWSKEGLENGSKANGSLKDVQDIVDKAKTEVDNVSDAGQKVVTAVGSAEKTLTAAMDEVMSQVSAIEFKASKDCTVYTKADSSSTKAGSLKKGDKVKVIGQSGLWSKIEENKWVESKHLTIADSSQAKEKANNIKETFTTAIEGLKSLFNF